jgi:hypothetical protein
MLGFLFSKKSETDAELIFDIGSKSVGGGIFERQAKGGTKLLYAAREPIAFQNELTGDVLLATMLRSFSNLLLHLEKYGINHLRTASGQKYRIRSATIVISSPWHSSETKMIQLNFDKPTVITKAFVSEIIVKEEKDFENSVEKSIQNHPDFCVLERKIMEIRLNGYTTAVPYGKETQNIEIRLFNSVASVKMLERIESLIVHYFHIDNFIFHTFSVASYVSIRDAFRGIEDFLIVQIGGEVTDVVIAKNGTLTETISFPFGHNGLLRVLDKICAGHPQCSLEALLTLHETAGITTTDKQKVESALSETKKLWWKHFNQAVSNFSQNAYLPEMVFLFEESPYSTFFETVLSEANPDKLAAGSSSLTIKVVGRDVLKKIEGNVIHDPILAMETEFAASLDQKNFISLS